MPPPGMEFRVDCRGTLPMKNSAILGHYSRTMPRASRKPSTLISNVRNCAGDDFPCEGIPHILGLGDKSFDLERRELRGRCLPLRGNPAYRVTSLTRKRTPLGPHCKPMPRVLGGWALMGEVPLYIRCCGVRWRKPSASIPNVTNCVADAPPWDGI